MRYLKVLSFLLSIVVIGCAIKKNTSINEESLEGYSMGTIVMNSSTNCNFYIKKTSTDELFDVLEEADLTNFKSNGLMVYFKYRRLRIKPKCPNSQTIELIAIKKAG